MQEKNKEYYLSLGFDKKAAEYFAAGRRRITAVTPNDNYTLTLRFDNGEVRVFDVAPLIRSGTVFEILHDPTVFHRVYIDHDNCVAWDRDDTIDSSIVWNNKLDLSGDTCYMESSPV